MPGILGLSSGLPLTELASDLTNAQFGGKFAAINQQEVSVQAEISAFATLEGSLNDFSTAVKTFSDKSTYQGRLAISEKSTVFTATVKDNAVLGAYEIEVTQLAKSHKLRSDPALVSEPTVAVGTGILTIGIGTDNFNVTIDSTNNTLEGIRDAVNLASDNTIVTANIVTVDGGSEIVFTSKTTGASNTIVVTTDDDDLNDIDTSGLSILDSANNLIQLQAAQDATLKVDGQTATSSTNHFTKLLDDVTLTIHKVTETPGETATLDIVVNKNIALDAVNEFIDKYNALNGLINSITAYDVDNDVAGPLLGNSLVRGIGSQLRTLLGDEVTDITSNLTRLGDLGIEAQLNGSLTVDQSILSNAVETNLKDVENLLASANGIAVKFNNTLDNYIKINGIIDTTQDNLESKISRFADARESLTFKSDSYFKLLTEQFTALEVQLANFQSTGDFLVNALNNLPGFNNLSKDK